MLSLWPQSGLAWVDESDQSDPSPSQTMLVFPVKMWSHSELGLRRCHKMSRGSERLCDGAGSDPVVKQVPGTGKSTAQPGWTRT